MIRVCRNKLNSRVELISNFLNNLVQPFVYSLLPIGIIVMIVFPQVFNSAILLIPVFTIFFGLVGILIDCLIAIDSLPVKLNRRFKIFGWRDDC